ncbi:hypothetical protein NDU88_006460 [Pleurodeles waltl]|uniref:Uncharacterized protein n=1 Tax=Pleurodeles waltl TaxID=8319 RepID=A0AAV7MD16_PLEWA|nr:hypothetical protein NDU88_006460 [Pleurodeles waltl]
MKPEGHGPRSTDGRDRRSGTPATVEVEQLEQGQRSCTAGHGVEEPCGQREAVAWRRIGLLAETDRRYGN